MSSKKVESITASQWRGKETDKKRHKYLMLTGKKKGDPWTPEDKA